MFGGHKAAIFTQVGQFYFGRWVSFSSAVTIVLIDGMQLAEYMYQYGLGVEIRDEFAIKDLDESYWDELADGAPSLPAKA